MSIRLLLLILLSLFGAGVWYGCRSAAQPEAPAGQAGPIFTASASADIVIVERGSDELATVQSAPSHVVLAPGERTGLSALAFDQQGQELSQATISWQVVDSRAGTITPRGVFRAGFATGTFRDAVVVTARAPASGGPALVQATATITVQEFQTQLEPVSVRVFPERADLEPKGTLDLVALGMDANGVAIPSLKFEWEMLEPLAGSISENGRLTASENVGIFPKAVLVTLASQEAGAGSPISASLNVSIIDPASLGQRISAMVVPQVISLRPGEEIGFTAMVLDRRGNQIPTAGLRWEVLDPRTGAISANGRFKAGHEPDIYPDTIRAFISVPGVEEEVAASGTVVIVDVTPPTAAGAQRLQRVSIFPERVELSPGESTRVSIVGLEGDIRASSAPNVRWSLDPPEIGEVSRFVNVTANDVPGIYEGAIRAEVTFETESGPVTREVSATLVIRDSLATVEITPRIATLAPGERMLFRAVGYDRNRILLADIVFRWSLVDGAVGAIDSSGLFIAEGSPGEYPGLIKVEAVQRQSAPPP